MTANDANARRSGGEHTLHADSRRRCAHRAAAHQFWIWAGANIAPINWVLGALGINLGPRASCQTIAVLVIGNLAGMRGLRPVRADGPTDRREPDGALAQRVRSGRRLPARRHCRDCSRSAGAPSTPGSSSTWSVVPVRAASASRRHWSQDRRGRGIMIVQVGLAALGFRAIARSSGGPCPSTLRVLAAMTHRRLDQSGVHWDYAGSRLHGAALWSA